MTAVVFLKKAFKLSQDKRRLEVIIPREDPGEALGPTRSNHFTRAATRVPTGSTWASAAPRSRRGARTSDSLLDNADDDDDKLMFQFAPLKPTIATLTSTPALLSKKCTTEEEEKMKEDSKPAQIPEWDDGVFWKRYGNKIRVGQSALMMYTGRR